MARCRVNTFLIQVLSSRSKIRGNVIAFNNPTVEIDRKFPIPLDEAREIFTVIFGGPSHPSQEDLGRTPLLVRAGAIKDALEWLITNSYDYDDVTISSDNLSMCPESGMPFVVAFNHQFSNKSVENSCVNETDDEEGITSGQCPFILHGLVGDAAVNQPYWSMTAIAVCNLKRHNKIFVVGRSPQPESIYYNSSLYPKMFPWLFP